MKSIPVAYVSIKGQQGVAEGSENNNVTAQKIFFARSNKAPKGWSYDHVGFITQDGKQIQMSGHKGNDVYVTNDVTDDPEFPKQNIKIVSLSKPVSVPTTNSIGAENCGTFVANVLQANGVKGIDTQKIYSVFKKPQEQGVAEAKYAGNIGIMELIKFFQTHPELKSEYDEIKREKGAIEAMKFALDAINAELEGEPYSVAEDQTEDDNITVQNNVETSFRGGYGGTLIAKTPERQVGYLNYSIYNDKPQIGMIFVAQDYRRRGVAMKMLKALQELSPNEEIDWGITTDAGSNLRKSINYRKVPNPEIIKKKAKLAGVRSKLARLNYRLEQLKNTDVELARKFVKTVGDRWNQLNDLEYRLENELYLDKGEYSKLIPENKYIKVLKK
jgi:GNAT superfamily N-acetyltransferase